MLQPAQGTRGRKARDIRNISVGTGLNGFEEALELLVPQGGSTQFVAERYGECRYYFKQRYPPFTIVDAVAEALLARLTQWARALPVETEILVAKELSLEAGGAVGVLK